MIKKQAIALSFLTKPDVQSPSQLILLNWQAFCSYENSALQSRGALRPSQ
jgi:hypothetical protein